MKYKHQEIKDFLLSKANLDDYYIVCSSKLGDGLIHYVDREGESCWVFNDNRDDVVKSCLEFLKDRGNPIFQVLILK